MIQLLEKITIQAARYGEQVRQLEDLGLEKDRMKVRMAWVGFRIQLDGTPLVAPARKAYWDAYCELEEDLQLDGEGYRWLEITEPKDDDRHE